MEQNKNISTLKLISSRDEAGNVRTFIFETSGLTWIAGQNQGYILPQAGATEAENQRWFTIASAPSERVIHLTTRVSESRFKQALNAMRPGEEIKAFDLGGDFTWEEESDEPVVMVAGGIGVTPFRSILFERHKAGKPLNTTLLYFNRTKEVFFQTELQSLSNEHPEFTLRIPIGVHITADKILELAPQARKQILYLSGPEPMVESIGSKLHERGITVKQDRFPGYDDKNY
jgi:ferredoxin-NADP reductase